MKIPRVFAERSLPMASPSVRVNPAALTAGAAGMADFGQAVAKISADVLEQKQARDDGDWLTETTSAGRRHWLKYLEDAKAAAPEGAPEFTPGVMKTYDDWQQKTIAAAPSERARSKAKERLAALGTAVFDDALTFETRSRTAKRVAGFDRSLEDLAAAAMQDPERLGAVRAEALDNLRGAGETWMHPEAVTRYRQAIPETLTAAAMRGRISRDPAAAKRALESFTDEDTGTDEQVRWLGAKARQQLIGEAEAEIRQRDAVRRAELAQFREGLRADIGDARSQLGLGLDPGDRAIADIAQRAAAAEDPSLARQAASLVDRRRFQNLYRTWTPAALQDRINARRAEIGARKTIRPGDTEEISVMEDLLGSMNTQLAQDPLSWAGRVGLVAVPPLQLTGDGAAASMKARSRAALGVAAFYGVEPRFLTDEEENQLKRELLGANADGQLALVDDLAAGFGPQTFAILKRLAPEAPVLAHAAGLAQLGAANRPAAYDALAGTKILEENKAVLPAASDRNAWTADELGAAAGFLGSTRAAIVKAAEGIFAQRAMRRGLAADDLAAQENLWREALQAAAGQTAGGGGLGTWNDRRLILPPGVDEGRFTAVIEGINDNALADLAGGALPRHANGDPFDAEQLKDATLIDAGQGRYLVDVSGSGETLIAGPAGGYFMLDFAAAAKRVKEGPALPLAVGQIEEGNVDLAAQPRVENADGTVSTVRSISVTTDKGTYLLPTVSPDGKIWTNDQAAAAFKKTGRHLGRFDSVESADAFAEALHNAEAWRLQQPILGGAEDNQLGGGSGNDLLTDESPEVTKEDYKRLQRIFPELGRGGGGLDEVDINNAYGLIIKSRTKYKKDPFTDAEIREMATNPRGKMKPRKDEAP